MAVKIDEENRENKTMTDNQEIAFGLSEIFSHRESFIVVALTGRTGSGCSTVAKILGEKKFGDTPFPSIPIPPINQEDRKDKIIQTWLAVHWHPFKTIQVSQIILLLALNEPYNNFINFINNIAKKDITKLFDTVLNDYDSHKKTCDILKNPENASDDEVVKACEHIFVRLPEISELIKRSLLNSGKNIYTPLFQILGDNVRRSGNPLSELTVPNQLLVLPETITKIIKLACRYNKLLKVRRDYFVIDAVRHPFEIRYLSERISPFYTIAVSTDEISRIRRLQHANLRQDEIRKLDEKEYPSEQKQGKTANVNTYSGFVSQHIRACLEISDVYIRNIGTPEKKDLNELGRQICRYIALMQHLGLVTPTGLERCMHVAFSVKLNSGCISRQVGAVVTDERYSIKAVGWNDVPSGQVPCLLRNTAHVLSGKDDVKAYSNFEKNDAPFRAHLQKTKMGELNEQIEGRNNTYCFKKVYNELKKDNNQVHTRALHAEENAFLQLSKYGGQGLQGGCLFTTASPCELCAKKARQLGIKKIFYIDPYPGISLDHILTIGEDAPEVTLFSGSIGRAYHSLYEPIMPFKDELERIIASNSSEGNQSGEQKQEDLEL